MVVSFLYRFVFLCQFRITVRSEAALLGGLRLPWQSLNNAYFFLKPRRRIECKCLICLDCRRWSQALVPAHIYSIPHGNTHSWLDGWFAAKHNETIPRPGAGEHHQSVAFGCRWLIPLSKRWWWNVASSPSDWCLFSSAGWRNRSREAYFNSSTSTSTTIIQSIVYLILMFTSVTVITLKSH